MAEPEVERLHGVLGLGSSPGGSPEVPAAVLARDAMLLGGGQLGYRVNKYGTIGLDYVWQATGDAVGGPTGETLKAYKTYISKVILALIAAGGLVWARGATTRIILFGMAFEAVTWTIDQVEAYVLKAAGVA